MASTTATATTSHLHFLPSIRAAPRHTRSPSLPLPPRKPFPLHLTRAKPKQAAPAAQSNAPSKLQEEEEVEVEVEEEMPWIQEKAMDLVEFTGTVSQAVPGPRIRGSRMPWLLAIPLAYVGVTFVVAFVKTVRRFTSPNAKRKRMAIKNKQMLKSVDDLFAKGREAVSFSALKELSAKTGFSVHEIVRKYIRYALNEHFFSPDLVADLIHLRKESMLPDAEVTEILNEVSRRIVRERGPVLMNTEGFSKKGLARKVAVKQLFGKIFYLSELPEFCSTDSSLIIKEIFGVTDEDVDALRVLPQSKSGDVVESAEKMIYASESDTDEIDDSTQ